MASNIHYLGQNGGGAAEAEARAPQLPVEPHIVAAALQAERLRVLSEQMLLALRYAPRDGAMFERLQDELLAAWSDLHDHYSAYRAVLECKGQA